METLKKYKIKIMYIVTIIFSVAFILTGYSINKIDSAEQEVEKSYKAKVLSIEEIEEQNVEYNYENIQNKIIKFIAKIDNDEIINKEVLVYQYIDEIAEVNPKIVEVGDSIIISLINSRTEATKVWTFLEYNRINIMALLLSSFFVFVVIFGRKKGIDTIISLIFTVLSIFLVFIPSIIKGNNIYLSSIIICVFIIFMNLLLINGFNKKTLCAIVGNLGGLIVAGVLSLFISEVLNLTGLIDQDSIFLLMVNPDSPIDLKAILWSGIVIGSLGAVMDVSMSIASAMNELSINMDDRKFETLLKSGINMGRDAIGTMTNTLILAYIGSSLSVVLLLVVYYKDTLLLLNLEMIVFEIIQAIIGSMAILFTIPITSLFSAYIFKQKKDKGN